MTSTGIENRVADRFGINLIGYFSSDTGLGNTARVFAEALRRLAVPFSVVNIQNGAEAQNTNREWSAYYATYASEAHHPINLYILHTDFRPILAANPWMMAPGRIQVAMLWWETTALPQAWIPHLRKFDAIAACTSFIANVAANQLPFVPVIEIKHPLLLPPDVRPHRARFGISEETTLFVSSFDPNSDPTRKNPAAQVVVFQEAFPPEIRDVRLLIRVRHADSGDFARRAIQRITSAARGDPRIQLVTEPMSYRDTLEFYASGDVFVSLHRSEGLGLGLMEAMALSKPVIATGWSGNMSFMDYTCACPVRYRLEPVRGDYDFMNPEFLGPHAVWATPLIEDATAWMKELHANPAMRKRIGTAAKARIDAYQEQAWGAAWVDNLVALWRARNVLPELPGKYSSKPVKKPVAQANSHTVTADQ